MPVTDCQGNAGETATTPRHTRQGGCCTTDTGPWRGRGEPGPCAPAPGTSHGAAAAEDAVPAARKGESRVTEGASNATSSAVPREVKSRPRRDVHTAASTAARSRALKRGGQWSARRREVRPHRGTPLGLQRKFCRLPRAWTSRSVKTPVSHKGDKRCVIPRAGGAWSRQNHRDRKWAVGVGAGRVVGRAGRCSIPVSQEGPSGNGRQ